MPRSRSSVGFQKLLAAGGQPVYAVDESRAILACNPACLAWLKVAEADLVGQRCDFHSLPADSPAAPPAATVARALCPPPQALHGQRVRGVIELTFPDGETSRREAEFVPLTADDGTLSGTLVVVSMKEAAPPSNAARTLTADEIHRQLRQLRWEAGGRFVWERLVGVSPASRRCLEVARLAVESRVNVVVAGPPGSGREHLARSIHRARSAETDSPLIPLACPLLDVEQLELTIPRLVRSVSKTTPTITLLLQDVDQLATEAQPTLHRLLAAHRAVLRTLSTARQSLIRLAQSSRFHEDLAATLETIGIELPALAARLGDLPLLVQSFVEEINATGGRQSGGFSPESLDLMATHRWPGNLDELAAVVREACATAEGPLVTPSDLPASIRLAGDAAAHPRRPEETIQLDAFLVEIETEVIKRALKRARGNKAKAARLLGISRARLHRRAKELRLEAGE